MPICITGMHFSGASMTARALQQAGLDLGNDTDLRRGLGDSPGEGYEHVAFSEINDKILRELGGAWDDPSALPADWRAQDRFDDLRARAHRLVQGFDARRSWGWKDAHNSLTLPFWRDVVPDIGVVVCLRHPLEVALRAQAQGLSSYTQCLALWKSYNERILEAVEPDRWIVTHYDSYFADPRAELARLTTFAGMKPSAEQIERAVASVNPARRPAKMEIQELVDAGSAPGVLDLYCYLLERSGLPHPAPSPAAGVAVSAAAEIARQPDQPVTDPGSGASIVPAIEHQLDEALTRLAKLEAERDLLQQAVRHQEELLVVTHDIRDQLDRTGTEIQSTLYDLHAIETGVRMSPPTEGADHVYRQRVDRFREVVHTTAPTRATVLVISRGDPELVKLYGRPAWHFPRTMEGVYTGYHPDNSGAAIVHLEAMRALGADYLAVPATELWWLDHYADFRAHVEARYRLLHRQDETGWIFSLRERPKGALVAEREVIEQLVTEFQLLFDRDPVILDWTSGRDLSDVVRELRVFVPPASGDLLPYLDSGADIVVLASRAPARVAEATRVASAAIVMFEDEDEQSAVRVYGGGAPPEVQWLAAAGSSLPSASIIVPCYDGLEHTRVCLETLVQTLPRAADCEVIVVDDASTDGTERYLRELAATDDRIRVVRNLGNAGFVGSVNRGAEEATGEILVFLNNDTILLPGWLAPLLRMFRDRSDVGVVGGKLLYPDGRLQEAGGVVFQDGSAAKFGGFDPDATAPLYNFVRDVDYCSAALLATSRVLFEGLGGFDRAFAPGYYEDTDYCFRVRAHGYRVLYQPESAVVHLEGATAGLDVSEGMKRHQVLNHGRFVERWAHELSIRPARPPEPFDFPTLYALSRTPAAIRGGA